MIDLHTHSCLSDGELSPQHLIERASLAGIQTLAITDHDCIDAHHLLATGKLSHPENMDIIPGTEISTRWDNQEIHVLGLCIDVHDASLNCLLQQQQQRRRNRAEAISLKLERAGICGLLRYLDTLPCHAVGRNHVADFLISQGLIANKQQAFSKYLARNARAYVAAEWCSIADAVQVIRNAGGIAALAHPDRYTLSKPKFRRLLDEFCAAGGTGLEVSYSNLNTDVLQNLATICAERGLWATVGSDFHSPAHNWMDLGRIRQLPPVCKDQAIWHHPAWQKYARARLDDAPRQQHP
jgi:predicted metal-dependent phosphoesterase TrpH